MLQALLSRSSAERMVIVLDSEYVYKGIMDRWANGAATGGRARQGRWGIGMFGNRFHGREKTQATVSWFGGFPRTCRCLAMKQMSGPGRAGVSTLTIFFLCVNGSLNGKTGGWCQSRSQKVMDVDSAVDSGERRQVSKRAGAQRGLPTARMLVTPGCGSICGRVVTVRRLVQMLVVHARSGEGDRGRIIKKSPVGSKDSLLT